MPGRPRDVAPGLHHVWVNATGNWPYFTDEGDRQTWIGLLERVSRDRPWTVVAFCQMTTHVHLIVDVPSGSLPLGMQYLNREYSKRFNLRHERTGHFVRQRYGSRRIESGRDLAGTYAYVVLNPVRERMCPRAEDWRWCSYATSIGITRDFPFVDAGVVISELGGATDALRALVSARSEHLSATATSR